MKYEIVKYALFAMVLLLPTIITVAYTALYGDFSMFTTGQYRSPQWFGPRNYMFIGMVANGLWILVAFALRFDNLIIDGKWRLEQYEA